jgi:tetratricopeptide (TPR) repeat protein
MKRKSRREVVAQSPVVRPRNYFLLAAVALGLLTLLAFSNSFSTGFPLDNGMLILGDTRIQAASGSNIGLILHQTYWWPNGESGLYRPFTTLSYLFNYAILGNGNHPAGYHWINFFLHSANVFLVFAIMLRLAGTLRTAFFVAMLWAVHPVLTESVTNIVGRADLLAGFGVLSGFLWYVTGARRWVWLAGLAISTAIGVFSKESAVVLPAIIVVYELARGKRWRRMLEGLAATLVPIGLMLWQRAAVLRSSLPAEYPFVDNPIAGAGFWVGRLTAVKVLARYLWLAIWPVKLSSDYSFSEIPLARGSFGDWVCWIAIAGALVLAVILWKRSRLAFFFMAFAFLNLLPASNLLFPIGTIMAERLLYLPLVGLMAAVVLAVDIPSITVGVLLVALFGVRTWVRNLDWVDDRTMAVTSVRTSPDSFKTHQLLAAMLLSDHEVDRAVAEADRAIAILAPLPDALDTPQAWTLAAACHRAKGDSLPKDNARGEYEETARLAQRAVAIGAASRAEYDRRHGIVSPPPASAAEGYRTLASAYLHLSENAPALAAALEAQKIDPANVGVYVEIADADYALGRGEEAAVTLAEGMFLTGDRNLLEELMKLYQSGVDSKGCAVKEGPKLNPSCEIVVRDLCEAAGRAGKGDVRRRMGCPGR